MKRLQDLSELIQPIRDDLTSGAAEIALRAITVFQTVLDDASDLSLAEVKQRLVETARALKDAQPAMAPLFHLGNKVLLSTDQARSLSEISDLTNQALMNFEKQLCASAEVIADRVYDLVPPGELVFAYSFAQCSL
jgi:translation initiation factor 2B subunit (eIF-2B alpha/beta/delta family)